MKRFALLATAAVAVPVAIFASQSGADRAARTSATTVSRLHYVIRFPAPTFVDHDPPGFHKGDNVIIEGDAFDRANRRRVGRHFGVCTFVVPGRTLQCTSSTAIDGRGQLVAEGAVRPGGEGVAPLVGGTGTFAGARGERTLTTRPRRGNLIEADVIFRLVR